MRTYVESTEIAHLWAHQTQPSASSASMSFSGPRFSSYGTVIAEIAQGKHGRVYLINDAHYSSTSSRHRGLVRDAIPHGAPTFDVPGSSQGTFADPRRILAAYATRVQRVLRDGSEAKTERAKLKLIAEAATVVARLQQFADAFGLKATLPKLPGSAAELDKVLAKYQRAKAAAAKREAAAQARRDERRRHELAADREHWLAGGDVDAFAFSRVFPVDLRIVGDAVETSRGAFFPVSDAQHGLALVERAIAQARPWQANGHRCHLGPYQLERIDPDGTVHAGCHVVAYAAIQRIAQQVREY